MGDVGDKGERVCQQGRAAGSGQPVGRRMGRSTLGLWIGKKE